MGRTYRFCRPTIQWLGVLGGRALVLEMVWVLCGVGDGVAMVCLLSDWWALNWFNVKLGWLATKRGSLTPSLAGRYRKQHQKLFFFNKRRPLEGSNYCRRHLNPGRMLSVESWWYKKSKIYNKERIPVSQRDPSASFYRYMREPFLFLCYTVRFRSQIVVQNKARQYDYYKSFLMSEI